METTKKGIQIMFFDPITVIVCSIICAGLLIAQGGEIRKF